MGKTAGRAPSLRDLPGICLTTEEKSWKNLNQGMEKPHDVFRTEISLT